jgi:hypothetical protein
LVLKQTYLHLIFVSCGIALLLAGLFFNRAVAVSMDIQADTTPTPDRLAEPTLPASPSQADYGAQVYWLSCMPCHGDVGQGLTDEFRATYPPEEEYCWESGCHGPNPYESGFTLPKKIPGVIGESTLAKFTDAAQLHAYIRATMPFWKPGSLAEEESWRVTAFLLRQNDLWDASAELDASNATNVKIPRGTFLTPVTTPPQEEKGDGTLGWLIPVSLVSVVFVLLYIFQKNKI